MATLVKIDPYYYVHVQDTNKNIERLETGPQTIVLQDHEKIITGKNPKPMITLAPYTYCEIKNPVMKNEEGELQVDNYGQVKVNHGDSEYRTSLDYSQPFPLHPGEQLVRVQEIETIRAGSAAKVYAVRDFEEDGVSRKAGDEWLIPGPKTYIPRVEVAIDKFVHPETIGPNQALRIRAKRECKDQSGIERKDGEEWLVRDHGFYLPAINEEVVEQVLALTLTDAVALHLTATQTFTDVYGVKRKAGQQWLVTNDISSTHIIDVYETLNGEVEANILSPDEFCYILDPCDDQGNNQVGKRILKEGPCSYFLKPGESIDGGIQ